MDSNHGNRKMTFRPCQQRPDIGECYDNCCTYIVTMPTREEHKEMRGTLKDKTLTIDMK